MRFAYIDQLKGLAMLMVVMTHLLQYSLIGTFVGGGNPIGWMTNTMQMPLFMFLSGVVVSHLPRGKYLLQKIVRFLWPMLVIGGIYALCCGNTILGLVADSWKLGYWYLFVLALFYCLLAIYPVHELQQPHQLALDLGFSLFVLILLYALKHFAPAWLQDLFCLRLAFKYWPYFIVGYLMRKYRGIEVIKKWVGMSAVCVACYAMVVLLYDKIEVDIAYWILGFSATILLIHVFSRIQTRNQLTGFLEQVGRGSLYVYIYHYFLLQVIHLEVAGKWFALSGNYLLEALLVLSLAFVVIQITLFVGKIIEKDNVLRIIFYGVKL